MKRSIMRNLTLQMRLLARLGLVPLMLLAGCTVGPDFAVPPAPDVPLIPDALPARVVADGRVQRFVDRDLPGEWWTLFRCRELTNLVQQALRNNHDLKAAQAALRVARANYEAQKGALFPLVGLNENSTRQKVATADLAAPTVSGDPYFTLHTAQLTISYVPDVFGGIRRQVEAASAQAQSQRFMLEATYLTLTSNIALAAIQEASLMAQIQETQKAVGAQRTLAEGEGHADHFKSASTRDWAALRASIAQMEQTLPLLKKQFVAQRDLLVALTGQFAGNPVPAFVTPACLRLPADLPVALPSQIVERRPDVRVAQANFHAASASVGVAIANRLPLFNLTGNIGRTSSQFGNLANPAPQFLFWTVAGSVTQTVFDGFTLAQRQRAAEAGLTQAAEQYQSALVIAFQNVTDALYAIQYDAVSVDKARDAEVAAQENLCLTVGGFVGYNGAPNPKDPSNLTRLVPDKPFIDAVADRFGDWWNQVCASRDRDFQPKLSAESNKTDPSIPSGIDVVSSEQLYLATRLSLVTARASRSMDVVALFQALGGGWWNRADVEEAKSGILDADAQPSSRLDRE